MKGLILGIAFMAFILGIAISTNGSEQSASHGIQDIKLFVPLLGVFMASLILPMIKEGMKNNAAKKSLCRMIRDDVKNRTEQVSYGIRNLHTVLITCDNDPTYEPFMINNKGLDDYIDWKTEKWLLPPRLSGAILEFYSNELELSQFIEFLFGQDFPEHKLSRERKIGAMRGVLEKMKNLETQGNVLLQLMK